MMSDTMALRPLTRVLDCLIDERVGIIESVAAMRADPDAPAYFHFSAQLCDTLAFSPQGNCGRRAAASTTRERAALDAIIQAVASSCAALRPEEDEKRPVCMANAAPFRCAQPEKFALFDERQHNDPAFPWVTFDSNTPVHWSEALDPIADEPVAIPSAMTYLPYAPSAADGEAPIAPPTSIGLACHWTPAQAALDALCDVIECDAVSLLWEARLSMPQVRIETLSDSNYEMAARFERSGGSVRLLKIDLGIGVPVFVAALSNPVPSAPARVFAAGTDLDPEQGIRKVFETLAHVQYYCNLIHHQLPRWSGDLKDIAEQKDHLNYWCDHANAAAADFLFASPERTEFDAIQNLSTGSAESDLAGLLKQLDSAGYQPLLADLTTPDIADVGLTVLRAVVPGLQPLFFGSGMGALGGARLRNLGNVKQNHSPHPFPRKGVLA